MTGKGACLLLLLVAGCGRVGFTARDELPDAGTDVAMDSLPTDGGMDAADAGDAPDAGDGGDAGDSADASDAADALDSADAADAGDADAGDGGRHPTCASAACDIVHGGCAAGFACHLGSRNDAGVRSPECDPAGEVLAGQTCSFADDCAPGLGCALGECRPYCCGDDGACPGTQACTFWITTPGEGAAFCMETDCDPFVNSGCGDLFACYVDDRGALCRSKGTLALGDPCSRINECAPGAVCFGNAGDGFFCRAICSEMRAAACDSGFECRVLGLGGTDVGACRPLAM